MKWIKLNLFVSITLGEKGNKGSTGTVLRVCYRPHRSAWDMDRDLFTIFNEMNTTRDCVIWEMLISQI